MKKLLISTAIALTFSTGAFAGKLDGNIKLGSSYNEKNFLVMYKINKNGWSAY